LHRGLFSNRACTADTNEVMVGLFMIEFAYEGSSHYANVIEYPQSPKVFFVDILNNGTNLPKRLILKQGNDGIELSGNSFPASERLVQVISKKILERRKTEAA